MIHISNYLITLVMKAHLFNHSGREISLIRRKMQQKCDNTKMLGGFKQIGMLITIVFIVGPLCVITSPAGAEVGVSGTEIVIGMSNALSGPTSALGSGVKRGSVIYINKINSSGGIYGRKIRLVSYDDGYEPERTIINTKKLIEQDKVLFLFGYVGTPTSSAAVPVFSRAKVPYLFPFTGAEFLRNPVNKYIFNVRASYFQETEGLVDHLINDRGITKIGLFIQDDSYGNAGKAGVIRALRKRDLRLSGEGKYKRNTVNVDEGLAALRKAHPKAVIMVGAYKACAAFITKAKSSGFNPLFLNISFVGTNALIQEIGQVGEEVIISQVMPMPTDSSIPIIAQYQADMNAAGYTDFEFTSLEGYVNAVVLVEALKKSGPNLTRKALISNLEGLNIDIGGMHISFNPKNHQGLKKVYFTKINDGQAVAITTF